MTPLKMPEPAYSYHGKALYTIEALRDVLEQAAQVCEAEKRLGLDDERTYHGSLMANEIRAMKEQIK